MLHAWIERLKTRRRERLAHDYGSLTEEERLDLARARGDLGARARGSGRSYGRTFDRELDAEEGRPGH
jgi:hypothetical protein